MKLSDASAQFIGQKRRDGLSYKYEAEVLQAFSVHSDDIQLSLVQVDHVKAFLNLRPNINSTWRKKHHLLTRFFEYWRARGEVGVLPIPINRPLRKSTFVPHIFSEEDVRALLKSARTIRGHPNCLRDGETMRAFLLFLYATGATCNEVIALEERDIDLTARVVRIGSLTRRHFRTIPIALDLAREMGAFLSLRHERRLSGPHFFQRSDGGPLTYDGLRREFAQLLRICHLTRTDGRPERPRLSDLRASFAVHRVSTWVRNNDNLGTLVPALAAYVGREDISDTERMMSMVPERFRAALDDLAR